MEITSSFLVRKRAKQFKQLRNELMIQLYPTTRTGTVTGNGTGNGTDLILSDLLGSFKRFAGNQQTAFDSGSVRSNASSSGNLLERQVERAISQVLGRSPGRGADSFISALNDAFPVTADGRQITTTPSRSIVSLYSPGSNGSSSGVGQLSAKQAALYRQTSIVANDGLKVLESLATFVPQADKERVEALRALIRSEIKALIEEFGRVDEPRPARVQTYLNALELNLAEFGERTFFNDPMLVATVDDESQTTGFELLKSYVHILRTTWNSFSQSDQSRRYSYSLSERVERASVLLPVIAQGNTDFENAMESVGFNESERRSRATKFTTLAASRVSISQIVAPPDESRSTLRGAMFTERDSSTSRNFNAPDGSQSGVNQLSDWLPNITVNDLTDWLDRFTNTEGPAVLDNSGQYGLEFVTDQADKLFWTIAPIVSHLKTTSSITSSSRSTLEQILSNERVSWSLDNLLSQLNALADLAA